MWRLLTRHNGQSICALECRMNSSVTPSDVHTRHKPQFMLTVHAPMLEMKTKCGVIKQNQSEVGQIQFSFF